MPSFRELLNYCRRTGWEQYKDGGDHYRFRKILPDGRVLRTKVSHSLSREIPEHLFKEILKKQLETTVEDFNRNS